MTETYYVKQKQYTPTDPRLGRHVRHDSRSLNFQVPAEPLTSLKSVRHSRAVPVFDQGNLGSCTGNAAAGCIGTGQFWSAHEIQEVLSPTDAQVDEVFAIGVYSEATGLDPFPGFYPPNDTGSDGLSVAKVLQTRGLISGYQHATSLEAALTALQKQPVITGTVWRTDMFNPEPDGRLRITGSDEGGHEYILDELDCERGRVWMQNSWSTDWGIEGRAYFTWDDFRSLLADDGDVTVFTPIALPAPVPTPPPAPPAPTPVPEEDYKAEFLAAAFEWNQHRRLGQNRRFQIALNKFLDRYR